jgi:hypothetical protein
VWLIERIWLRQRKAALASPLDSRQHAATGHIDLRDLKMTISLDEEVAAATDAGLFTEDLLGRSPSLSIL